LAQPIIEREKTDLPTEEGKLELIDRIKEIITCDFEIVEHFAGIGLRKRQKTLVGTPL
jgi:hypothetical protein